MDTKQDDTHAEENVLSNIKEPELYPEDDLAATRNETQPSSGERNVSAKNSDAQLSWRLYTWAKKHWQLITAIAGVLTFIVPNFIQWRSFTETLRATKEIEEVNLARELLGQFDNKTFESIHHRISCCQPLYYHRSAPLPEPDNSLACRNSEPDARLDWTEINKYLNLLDDIAYFHNAGALQYQTAKHFFGKRIIQTLGYAEIRRYIAEMESNEEGAYKNLKSLNATLENDPDLKDLASLWRRDCMQETVTGSSN